MSTKHSYRCDTCSSLCPTHVDVHVDSGAWFCSISSQAQGMDSANKCLCHRCDDTGCCAHMAVRRRCGVSSGFGLPFPGSSFLCARSRALKAEPVVHEHAAQSHTFPHTHTHTHVHILRASVGGGLPGLCCRCQVVRGTTALRSSTHSPCS